MSGKCNHCYDKIATHKCTVCKERYFCLGCIKHHEHDVQLIKKGISRKSSKNLNLFKNLNVLK
jgi:nitrate reductase beta subunit